MTLYGRLRIRSRPGSWRRPAEWEWGRQACDVEGCFVFDVGWILVEWLRGAHKEKAG